MRSGATSNLVLSSLVFEYGCDAMILLDSERIVRALNPAAQALLGWRNEEVAGHLDCRTVLGCRAQRPPIGGDAGGPGECLCERVLLLHRPMETVKLRLRPHTRRELVVSASGSPLPIDHLGGAVLVLRTLDAQEERLVVGELRLGEITMDVARHQVYADGRAVHLTPIEFDLLRYFLANAGRVISRQELLEHVWHYQDVDDRNLIKSHIGLLRRRLADAGVRGAQIANVYGVGYILSCGDRAEPVSAGDSRSGTRGDAAGDWWR
jgi:DNA-binding winged helix-turn-helix (wHTH) protein